MTAELMPEAPLWQEILISLVWVYCAFGAMAGVGSVLQGFFGGDSHRPEARSEAGQTWRSIEKFVLRPIWSFVSWPLALHRWWKGRNDIGEADPNDHRLD